jgi:hypothetical protein
MNGDDPQTEAPDLPSIPTFFTSDDLPAWLRPEAETPQTPPETRRETRARIAWADARAGDAPARQTSFGAAADATWNLLAPPPRHAKRGRRAGGTY